MTTAIVLAIIILVKFKEGAWMTVIVAPALVLLMRKINQHYTKVSRQVDRPIDLQISKMRQPAVIIPIEDWDKVAERAVRFGLLVSEDVTAIHISAEQDDHGRLRQLWKKKVEDPVSVTGAAPPRLEIIESPYRQISRPILEYVKKTARKNPDRLIAVVIPELVEPHWYEYLLHRFYGTRLRTELFLKGGRNVVVISTPWYLQDR